jgi:hypothetical protein
MDSPEATLVAEADATMCLIRKNTKAEALLFNQEVLKNVSI